MESLGYQEDPEAAARAERIAKALGSKNPIYIGDMFDHVTPTNALEMREVAQAIQEIRDLPETPEL